MNVIIQATWILIITLPPLPLNADVMLGNILIIEILFITPFLQLMMLVQGWENILATMLLFFVGFSFTVNFAGPGCQIAGFLTVFSSELSVFTLTVITLERWYAITYAIHLNRRLHLGAAGRVMAAGWLYAASAATAPLVGISGYSRTSICLPMESRTAFDVAYLVGLLTVKGLAFLLICICYLKMYLSIRSSSVNRQTPDLHANRWDLILIQFPWNYVINPLSVW